MFLDTLSARSLPITLVAALAACGGTTGDDKDEGETDTEDSDASGDDTVDTSGGGENFFELTGFRYGGQIGIDSEGRSTTFSAQGNTFSSFIQVILVDNEGTDSNFNDDTTCSFVFLDLTQQGFEFEGTPPMFPDFSAQETAYAGWLDEQSLFDGLALWDGNFQVTDITLDGDGDPQPCPFPAEVTAEQQAELAASFMQNADGEISTFYAGIGDEQTTRLEELLADTELTADQKANIASGFFKLPAPLTSTEGEIVNFENVVEAFELNGDNEIVPEGTGFKSLPPSSYSAGDGKAAAGVYIVTGLGTIGFATE